MRYAPAEKKNLIPESSLYDREVQENSKKTYNTGYSLVVTDPTTNPALTGLSKGERTGSRVLQWIWSYVMALVSMGIDMLWDN